MTSHTAPLLTSAIFVVAGPRCGPARGVAVETRLGQHAADLMLAHDVQDGSMRLVALTDLASPPVVVLRSPDRRRPGRLPC